MHSRGVPHRSLAAIWESAFRSGARSVTLLPMSASRVFLAVFLVALSVFSAFQLRALPDVWRGGRVPTWFMGGASLGPTINERSYPTFAVSGSAFTWGTLIALVGVAIHVDAVGDGGVCVLVIGLIGMLVLVPLVNTFNRPAPLVPPSRRGDLGNWAQRRARRSHGRGPGTHRIEIFEVRSADGGSTSADTFFYAQCNIESCGWMAGPIARDVKHPDPVETLRAQAAKHSSVQPEGPLIITG